MRIRARVIVKNFEIESRRKEKNMTQVELADILGLQLSRFAEIEQMKVKPTEEEAKSIALELNTKIDILFPEGYERIVDVFKNPIQRIGDFTPPMLAMDDDIRLLEMSDAKRLTDKIINDAGLSPKEMDVIDMMFNKEMTLEETGRKLGVSRERVRQIEAKALERMRFATPIRKDDL